MKPLETNNMLTLDSLLNAIIGDADDELAKLDGRSIQPTLHFLESARRRLERLVVLKQNGVLEHNNGLQQGEDHEQNGKL